MSSPTYKLTKDWEHHSLLEVFGAIIQAAYQQADYQGVRLSPAKLPPLLAACLEEVVAIKVKRT